MILLDVPTKPGATKPTKQPKAKGIPKKKGVQVHSLTEQFLMSEVILC